MSDKLTDKQELFCKEYLVDLNATKAAARAGYSEKTSQQVGSQNLSKLVVANRIAQLQEKRAERLEIDQDFVDNNLLKAMRI